MLAGFLYLAILATAACGRYGFDPLGDNGDARSCVPNTVFVTSTNIMPGQLGSIAAADAECAARATAAGLRGTYVAWLSTSTMNAAQRLGSARGWLRTDGRPFTDTVTDLTAGRMFYPITFDENGAFRTAGGGVITGTKADGTVATGATCADYTSTTATVSTGAHWTTTLRWTEDLLPRNCDIAGALYCFGVDESCPVTITPASGPKAFLSSPWLPSNGVAGADQHCMMNATAAGLGGNFKALISTTTASPASRFASTGPMWVRVDGIPLAADRAAMLNAELLDTSISVTADGSHVMSYVWTGGGNVDGMASMLMYTCNEWTIGIETTDSPQAGRSSYARQFWFQGAGLRCNNPDARLYCLEE